ncbi:MAG: molecular chaperone SurA [Gammaproteobacteria bacterium]|nr:molecular chaperone SurA [Gammaproteobacteria bacterium]
MNKISFFATIALVLASSVTSAATLIDKVIAIVEEDVITERELEARKQLIRVELTQAKRNLPDDATLHRQVLETMIRDSILLQEARSRGLKITEGQLNQAMQKISRDNNMNLTEFRKVLIAKDIDYEKYRETLRKELIVSSLQRQYTARTASVSEQEVDEFLRRTDDDSTEYEYKLAHILISLPDAASPEQVSKAQDKASGILSRLNQGANFEKLANENSGGSNALRGGDLGWRNKAEIPSLFTDAVLPMKPGEYAGPFRSASGYHIVFLADRKNAQQVLTQQIRSRHILLRPNEILSEEDAKLRLIELRQRILEGEEFDRLANLYSVDYGSGAEGGDIGWMGEGDTAKEYAQTVALLEIGKISQPFRSQFGWHIVEVTGRRTIDETSESKREKIYSQLLRQKQREVFNVWQNRLRDEAYIVIPDA